MMLKKIACLWVLGQNLAAAEPDVPEQLKVPEPNQTLLTATAKGHQIYQCVLGGQDYTWQLLAPDAQLFDGHGQVIIRHSAGPVWQYKDGSRLIGKAVVKVERAPLVAIPWLLIKVVSHEGQGLLGKVNYIQRINTMGGLPPLSLCNANHLGSEKRIEYTADYVFFAN